MKTEKIPLFLIIFLIISPLCIGEENKNSIGDEYLANGEYEKAIDFYMTALLSYEKEKPPNSRWIANTRLSLGAAYVETGQPEKAAGFFSRTIKALKSIKKVTPGELVFACTT
ncbi:MAG: tetratricopeptide repeat protein [Spirochaetales bacterium]|nr:tetratricopeptide repeat protein [Spirochaetales bacterium]